MPEIKSSGRNIFEEPIKITFTENDDQFDIVWPCPEDQVPISYRVIREEWKLIDGRPTRFIYEWIEYDNPKERPPMNDQPTIVCLVGSRRFKLAIETVMATETLHGNIVLSLGVWDEVDSDIKADLDDLHLRKIDLADEVVVVNVGGYIGKSTAREIEYARRNNKKVRYLERLAVEPGAPTGEQAALRETLANARQEVDRIHGLLTAAANATDRLTDGIVIALERTEDE